MSPPAPHLISAHIGPELVQPVAVLCQLPLYRHGVSQGRVGLVYCLHLHQTVSRRRLLEVTLYQTQTKERETGQAGPSEEMGQKEQMGQSGHDRKLDQMVRTGETGQMGQMGQMGQTGQTYLRYLSSELVQPGLQLLSPLVRWQLTARMVVRLVRLALEVYTLIMCGYLKSSWYEGRPFKPWRRADVEGKRMREKNKKVMR